MLDKKSELFLQQVKVEQTESVQRLDAHNRQQGEPKQEPNLSTVTPVKQSPAPTSPAAVKSNVFPVLISATVPDVAPKHYYEFERSWNSLKDDNAVCYKYFKVFYMVHIITMATYLFFSLSNQKCIRTCSRRQWPANYCRQYGNCCSKIRSRKWTLRRILTITSNELMQRWRGLCAASNEKLAQIITFWHAATVPWNEWETSTRKVMGQICAVKRWCQDIVSRQGTVQVNKRMTNNTI